MLLCFRHASYQCAWPSEVPKCCFLMRTQPPLEVTFTDWDAETLQSGRYTTSSDVYQVWAQGFCRCRPRSGWLTARPNDKYRACPTLPLSCQRLPPCLGRLVLQVGVMMAKSGVALSSEGRQFMNALRARNRPGAAKALGQAWLRS